MTLRNRYGQDTCRLNVNVLDRPGPPQGPLEPTDIEADAITLNWRPPKDNGGDEITNYVVEKKEPGGDWQKVSSAVHGTTFRVRNLREGVPYEFRVMAENQYGISDPLNTTEPVVAKNPFGNTILVFKKKNFGKCVANFDFRSTGSSRQTSSH